MTAPVFIIIFNHGPCVRFEILGVKLVNLVATGQIKLSDVWVFVTRLIVS